MADRTLQRERPGRNLALVLEYDGRQFEGWQGPPDERTVSSVLQDILEGGLGERPMMTCATRTDIGVHAEAQVACFRTRSELPAERIHEGLENKLPYDLAVTEVADVPEAFDAAGSASWSSYRYELTTRRSPLSRGRCWNFAHELDLDKLAAAAEAACGRRDFACFTDARFAKGRETHAELYEVGLGIGEDQLSLRLRATSFFPRMARRLVGCLIAVASGRLEPEKLQSWIEQGKGDTGRLVAPAPGLFLEQVSYPDESWQPSEDEDALSPTARRALAAIEDDEQPS